MGEGRGESEDEDKREKSGQLKRFSLDFSLILCAILLKNYRVRELGIRIESRDVCSDCIRPFCVASEPRMPVQIRIDCCVTN